MHLFNLLILCISYIAISVIINILIRNFAIKNNLFDIPNNRSSHQTPKPKGGGISIVLPLILTVTILFFCQMIDTKIAVSMIIGLTLVGITGLIDDYKSLSALFRVGVYIFSAGLSLHIIGGLDSISINRHSYYLGNAGYYLSILFLVWLTNLYNFMDGTDGFAAIQTICVSIFCCFLLYFSNNFIFLIIMLCLVSTTIGFLYWNWAPAKIFMGDVGSCTIGFFFGLLAVYTQNKSIISIGVWVILLSPFIGDATFTLISRILNNEKWYSAHNSHAYQKLYQLGLSHAQLGFALLAINLLIIWPLAYFANSHKNYELLMIMFSYIFVGIIWLTTQNRYKNIIKSLS